MELEQGLPVALAGTFLPLFCPKQLLIQLTLWPRRLVKILNILNRESAEGTEEFRVDASESGDLSSGQHVTDEGY